VKTVEMDSNLQTIAHELTTVHGCHTVILYGSRARGDHTLQSDYDVMGVRSIGGKLRDAREVNGAYWDLFVYSDSEIATPTVDHLHIRGGVVLLERDPIGTRFLKALDELFRKGPKPLPPDELQTKKVWAKKMLDRAAVGDEEGNYRRTWLQFALLEDYFAFRHQWYLGSKAALQCLKANDPAGFQLFSQSLKSPSDLQLLKQLAEHVTESNFA
jgi:predicted nucleotidyltransferase